MYADNTIGRKETWDYQPPGIEKDRYIRSHIPLDELERRARFPVVDHLGRENTQVLIYYGSKAGRGS